MASTRTNNIFPAVRFSVVGAVAAPAAAATAAASSATTASAAATGLLPPLPFLTVTTPHK